MKTRPLIIASILLVGIVTLIVLTVASKNQQPKSDVPSNNRLKWYAGEAKKSGKQRVIVPSGTVDYAGTESDGIEQAFLDYTVVVAMAVGQRTYQADDNRLITWYRFSIVEALTQLKNPVCFGCLSLSPPLDIPIDYNTEFLVPRNGGTMTIDGVEIQQKEGGFPEFQENQKYLLFISLYPNRVALTAGGPLGVYIIDENEKLTSLANRPDNIQEGIKTRFGNSLPSIKRRLKGK